jgi:4-carboxymuconolactone decarboxylase
MDVSLMTQPPASPTRLRRFRPDELDESQRELYDTILGGPRAGGGFGMTDAQGGLVGPFNAMLLTPTFGSALQALGTAIRFGGTLPDRAREIAILVVAAVRGSAFELHAHEAISRRIGIDDATLAAVAEGRYDNLAAGEQAVAVTTECLARDGRLDDASYAEAVATLGEQGLFELTTLSATTRCWRCN